MGTQEFRLKSKTKPASLQHCGKWASRLKMYISISSRGADFERVQYRRMLRRLGPGDTLIVKSIDRLGRNYTEIL